MVPLSSDNVSRASPPPLFGKEEVGIWRIKKRFPRYRVPIWSLWPNIRFLPSIVAEKNVTKNILDGRKDGRTDVKQYTPSHFGERGYNKIIIIFVNLECTSSHPKDHSVKFHYNRIKTFFNFHGYYHGNGGHFKIFYHKCTTTHAKKIHMKFHYNQTKTFF